MNCVRDGKFTGEFCGGCEVERANCELYPIVKAVREGRFHIYPEPAAGTCGSCGNFHPEPGERSGKCAVKEYSNSHPYGAYGTRLQMEFHPAQSRKACKEYQPVTKSEEQ
jgi:hypothetical protein